MGTKVTKRYSFHSFLPILSKFHENIPWGSGQVVYWLVLFLLIHQLHELIKYFTYRLHGKSMGWHKMPYNSKTAHRRAKRALI